MSNPFSTSNNPFAQGGWAEAQANASPTNSSRSSNSSGAGSGQEFVPPQSSYGVLPMSTSSGVMHTPIGSEYSTFRFVAQPTATDLCLISPNRSMAYRIRSNDTTSVITNHLGQQVATLQWPGRTLPYIEYNGHRARLTEWMPAVAGTSMRKIAVGQRTVYLSFNATCILFHLSDDLTRPPIAELGNVHTGCVLRIHTGMADQPDRAEIFNCLVIATVAIQSKLFVGLQA